MCLVAIVLDSSVPQVLFWTFSEVLWIDLADSQRSPGALHSFMYAFSPFFYVCSPHAFLAQPLLPLTRRFKEVLALRLQNTSCAAYCCRLEYMVVSTQWRIGLCCWRCSRDLCAGGYLCYSIANYGLQSQLMFADENTYMPYNSTTRPSTFASSRMACASLHEACQHHPKAMSHRLGPRSWWIGESSARGARAKILVNSSNIYIYTHIYIYMYIYIYIYTRTLSCPHDF